MKPISQSEMIIMDVVWAQASMGASEIAKVVASEKRWNIRTVKTLLARLVDKGILATEKEGRRFLYHPLINREDYAGQVFNDVSQQFFSGRAAPLFMHLAKSGNLSAKDIEEIETLIQTLKAAKGN